MIKERVVQLLEYKGIAKEKFYTEIGVTSANFRGKARETPLNSNTIENILSVIPDVNTEWLITGNGDMLKSNHNKSKDHFEHKKSTDSYNKIISGQTRSEYLLRTDRRKQEQLVPLYNLEASAGLVQLFQDSKSVEPIDTISIPNLPKCDGAVYVAGDSMYPLLKSGDIVMYKQVMDLPNDLFWGEMYLIHIDLDGDTYTTVKYVQRSDQSPDHIKLVSYNQHHAPKDIHLSKIKAAALVKASVRINSMM